MKYLVRMKNLLNLLTILVVLPTMAQDGVVMPVSNTLQIQQEDAKEDIILKAAHVVPSAAQLEALKDAYIAFVHFGPNTFTKKEWGTGKEDPRIFGLEHLDTDQWCRAMKEAGMKKVIFTAKHHDGFVMWQSRYTDHGIMSSPYKNGQGDILKELSESCQKYGLKLGVYLSPADLYQIESADGLYGNLSEYTMRTIPREIKGRPFKNEKKFTLKMDDYNEYFLNQLFELLTEYGPIHEVWFDGAHPKRKGGQTYNYAGWKEVIHSLAPEAVIFGKGDIRWGGNESGRTRQTEWNVLPYQGTKDTMDLLGDEMADSLGMRSQLYEADYLRYQPAEINTSIREGWFYRDEETQQTRSAEDVFDIYERAVGGNAIFLLNIPPNREGLFPEEDVAVLKEVAKRITYTYGLNLFKDAKGETAVLDTRMDTYKLLKNTSGTLVIETEQPVTINRLVLQEAVSTHGERVEEHALDVWKDGQWVEVVTGTNIGFKRILRFPETTSEKFRLRILKARFTPALSTLSAHYVPGYPPQLEITRNDEGVVTIEPRKDEFAWKKTTENSPATEPIKILYSLSEGVPDKRYGEGFILPEGTVKAVTVQGDVKGSTALKTFGMLKHTWVIHASSFEGDHISGHAIDDNASTYWISGPKSSPHYLEIDFGKTTVIKAFSYTPMASLINSMIEKGHIKVSKDGENWKQVESFEFGNLINDPTKRTHYFKHPMETQYVKIEATGITGSGGKASAAEVDFYSE